MRLPTTAITAAALLIAFTASALADSTLIFHDSSDDSESVVLIRNGILRMDEHPSAGDDTYVLFDSGRRVMTVIDRKDRSHYEMTADLFGDQAQMMQGAMQEMAAEMARQMEGLSPEDRRMMEQQMAQMGIDPKAIGQMRAAEPAHMPVFRKTGRSDRVTGIPCEIVEAVAGGRVTEELCIARPGAISIPAADQDAMTAMMDFMAKISATMGSALGMKLGADAELPVKGIPVRIRDMEENSAITLREFSSKALDAALFQIPSGYRKVDPMRD